MNLIDDAGLDPKAKGSDRYVKHTRQDNPFDTRLRVIMGLSRRLEKRNWVETIC
jgi:hypothetical protein